MSDGGDEKPPDSSLATPPPPSEKNEKAASGEVLPPHKPRGTDTSTVTYARREMFEGPIPAPTVLAAYAKIDPQLVDRIVSMAERESKHRHEMEKKLLATEERRIDDIGRRASRGQAYGLIIGVAGLVAASVISVLGHPAAGTIIGTVDLLGLVGTFVYGARQARLRHQSPPGGEKDTDDNEDHDD